jgi:hypothetical protein
MGRVPEDRGNRRGLLLELSDSTVHRISTKAGVGNCGLGLSKSVTAIPQDYPFVCIVGAPRSGTTILGDVLSKHSDVGYLFEPYFIWDHHIGPGPDDCRTAAMATPEISQWIRNEFGVFLAKTGKSVFLDKSPFNSFRIPFVDQVFPQGKYIHLQRDGRDVALSTYRKWLERVDYTSNGNYRRFIWEVWDKLNKRPFLRTKLRAISYELRFNVKLGLRNYYSSYHGEKPGWGVRYPGFEADLSRYSLLQFNALQWLHSVRQVKHDLEKIPRDRQLTICYEDFLSDPRQIVAEILAFIGLDNQSIPVDHVRRDKQQTAGSTTEQLREIMPLIEEQLGELGYSS